MRLWRRLFLTSTMSLLAVTGVVHGQQPSSAETIEVRVVNVDLIVTDRRGNPVHGLTADDFVVRENGKPRVVSNLSEYRSSATSPQSTDDLPSTPAEAAASLRPPRTIVFFFDSFEVRGPKANTLFDTLRQFLRTTLEPGDHVMIAAWHNRLVLLQPMTGSIEQAEEILNLLEERSGSIRGISAAGDQLARIAEAFRSDELFASSSESEVQFDGEAHAEFSYHVVAMERLHELKRRISGLQHLTKTLAGMEGRKALVVVSDRFISNTGTSHRIVSPFDKPTPPSRSTDPVSDTRTFLDRLIREANASSVSLYMLHPAGTGDHLPTPTERQGRPQIGGAEIVAFAEMEALSLLAEQTGGRAAHGPGDFRSQLDRWSSDFESYYSLGYRADGGLDRTRSIRVTTKNPAYRVRVRDSIVERSADAEMRDSTIAVLFHPPLTATIPLKAVANSATDQGGHAHSVAVTLEFPMSKLFAQDGEASFAIYVAAGNSDGDVSRVSKKEQRFRLPEVVGPDSMVTFSIEMMVRPGANVLGFSVIDQNSGERGFARLHVDTRS